MSPVQSIYRNKHFMFATDYRVFIEVCFYKKEKTNLFNVYKEW